MDIIAEIKKGIQEGVKFSFDDVMKGILALLNQSEGMKAELKAQKETIDAQAEKIEILEKKLLKIEIQNVRNNIIVRGLPYHTDALKENVKESPKRTREQVKSLMKEINLKDCALGGCSRFEPPKQGKNANAPGSVLIQFNTFGDKAQFFQALSTKAKDKSKSEHIKILRVENQIPISLKAEHARAEKRAAELRKTKKIKTRTLIKGTKICLMAEENGVFAEQEF